MRILYLLLLMFLSSCLQHRDQERFNDNPGYIYKNGLDIQINWGTVADSGNAIYSRVQTPSVTIEIQSQSLDTLEASFILDNMRRDTLPTISPDRGSVNRGSAPQIVEYTVRVNPGENLSVTLDNFPEQETAYRFGVVGDIQSNRDAGETLAAMAADLDLDFFIIVGDLVGQPEPDEYAWAVDYVKDFGIPVYVLVGNHELFSSGYERYRKAFGKTNYSFMHGNDLFLMLDAGDQGVSREVFNYADLELGHSSYENKFIFAHVTPVDQYGMRNNGFSGSFHAARFLNLLHKHKLDIMFSGHIHSYQDYKVEGTQYYVVGTGGGIQERFDNVECRFLVVEKTNGVLNVEQHDFNCPPVLF